MTLHGRAQRKSKLKPSGVVWLTCPFDIHAERPINRTPLAPYNDATALHFRVLHFEGVFADTTWTFYQNPEQQTQGRRFSTQGKADLAAAPGAAWPAWVRAANGGGVTGLWGIRTIVSRQAVGQGRHLNYGALTCRLAEDPQSKRPGSLKKGPFLGTYEYTGHINVYIYIYVYMYTYTYIHIHTYTYIYIP